MKRLKDKKTWNVNGYSIHLGQYDSVIFVKDENGNCIGITKDKQQSIVLYLNGIFTSGKKINPIASIEHKPILHH